MINTHRSHLERAGYSGTPLAKKLGLKPDQRSWREGMPESVAAEIGDTGALLLGAPEPPIEAAHVFVTSRAALEEAVARLRPLLAPSGFLWVSWPKRQGTHRCHRGRDPRRRFADRAGRREGVRGRFRLVGAQADDPDQSALTGIAIGSQ